VEDFARLPWTRLGLGPLTSQEDKHDERATQVGVLSPEDRDGRRDPTIACVDQNQHATPLWTGIAHRSV
jgi:hypothetical protein